MSKEIIIIAGPNGAGKTTFARTFLPEEAQCPRFINADLIAAGLSPFAPEAAAIRAGRLMLTEIGECVDRRENFAFETTLAGRGYRRHIRRWRAMGYQVSLYFRSRGRDCPGGRAGASGRARHPRGGDSSAVRGRAGQPRSNLQAGGGPLGGV